jgi:deoxyribonuclease V
MCPMILCVDVGYGALGTLAAAVGFERWQDAVCSFEAVCKLPAIAARYTPGSFYLRELAPLLALLGRIPVRPDAIVIDGYATLGPARPGLGAHLHRELGGNVAIVGVAKTEFRGASHAIRVLRGSSSKPLYVTAVGVDAKAAAENVRSMHGPYRLPTLIRRADSLSRR